MEDASREEVRAALADAVRLWRLEPDRAEGVVDAAVECLLAGVDSPSLCELAGASPRRDVFGMERLIWDALRELDMLDLQQEGIQRGAMVAMLHMLRSGRIVARDLTGWAHRHIGHDGDVDCQIFVDLDDMYDTHDYVFGYATYDESDFDRWTLEEANAFLDGRPSPRRSDAWPNHSGTQS